LMPVRLWLATGRAWCSWSSRSLSSWRSSGPTLPCAST
jgi:hypothetical protein